MTNNYYVYVHRKLSDNSIFYIGKGCNGRCRNKDWWSIVFEEKGFKPSIYKCQLSEKDALMEEESLIRKLFSEGVSLTNIKYIDSDDYLADLIIPEVDYEFSCDNRVAELQTKNKEKKTQNLEDYFQYNPNSVIPVKDFKDFIKAHNLKGLSQKSTNFISATRVAKYFNQKYNLEDVTVKNVRVKDLKKTCTCVIGLEFKI